MDLTTLWRRAALAVLTALIFLAAAGLSSLFARQPSGLEAIWAGNALLLSILMINGRSPADVVTISISGLAAGIGLHLWRQDAAAVTIAFSFANVIECLVALAVLRATGAQTARFERVRDVTAFIFACAAGAAASATLGSVGMTYAWGVPLAGGWLGWFLSGMLSQLVLTPMIVVCCQMGAMPRRGGAIRPRIEAALILGLVAGVATGIFFGTSAPLLFLMMPTVLIATFRLRAFGAVAAVATVALIAALATNLGHGPIVHHMTRASDQILLLQLFLATIFLSALPVAAVLAERDAQAAAARVLAGRYQAVVENIGEVIFRTDADGRWLYLNPAWEMLSGQPVAKSLGESWLARVHAGDRIELIDHVQPVFSGQLEMTRRELRFETARGVRWVEMLLQPLRETGGQIVGATGTMRDIDDRKQLEEHAMDAHRRAEQRAREATLLASTDELTGIANRRAFLRQLDQQIADSADHDTPLAVAIFDVDHFKAVNDRHGHAVGDRVLRQIAARANAVIRQGDVVGRLGGEEFGIVMPGASADDAALIAERLREAMETPREEDDQALPHITISVGLAVRERHGDAASLLAVADAALYSAKNDGRNRVRIAA